MLLKRIILLLTVVALMVAMVATSALPAFADVRRGGDDVPMDEERDQYWDELVDNQSDESEEDSTFTIQLILDDGGEENVLLPTDERLLHRYDIEPDELREEFGGGSPSTG